MADFDFGFGDFDLGFDPSLNFPDFQFDFPDFSGFDFNFPDFNSDFPTFDPGQFDLGFDPSFDLGQFSPAINDPFAIPTGDLSLPNFDLGTFLAQEPSFGLGDFNPSLNALGSFDFTPTSFGDVPPLPPDMLDLQALGLNNLSSDFGSQTGSLPALPGLGGAPFAPGAFSPSRGLTPLPGLGAAPSTPGVGTAPSSDDALKGAQAGYYKYAPLLGLGQLGLGLGGALMGAFGPQPKPRGPSDIERAAIQANIDNQAARLALDREAMQQQAALAREQMGMSMEQAELMRRYPLFESDPRFSALFDETTAAQEALSPDSPEIQAMTQQIYAVRQQAATEQYEQQREGIIERANRLGMNPAAELAQINEAEQQAKQALLVEAQQAALAFAQDRLDPSTQLLDAILKTVV